MSDTSPQRKLDAIVGAAIRALADTDVPDAQLGAFAAAHRLKVAEILGHTPSDPQPTDLVDLVGLAVRQALVQEGLVRVKPPVAKRLYVQVAGKRTSLTINPELIDRLNQQDGRSKAKTIVQEIANEAPVDVDNRSGWVEERINAYLVAPPDPHSAATTRH